MARFSASPVTFYVSVNSPGTLTSISVGFVGEEYEVFKCNFRGILNTFGCGTCLEMVESIRNNPWDVESRRRLLP